MVAGLGLRRFIPVVLIAVWCAACNPEASPTDKLDPTGILLVDVGEQVQAEPPTEALKVAFSQATELAAANAEVNPPDEVDPPVAYRRDLLPRERGGSRREGTADCAAGLTKSEGRRHQGR